MKSLMSIAVLFVLLSPLSAQVNGTDVGRSAAQKLEVSAVALLPGDVGVVELSNHAILVMSHDEATELAASYGNPEAVVSISWTSGGLTISLDVRQQAGEADAKFAKRAKSTVEAMKLVFPPDPAPQP